MGLNSFRKGINDGFFETSSGFQKHVMYQALNIDESSNLQDTSALRALLVFMRYGMVKIWKCSKCKSSCTIRQNGKSGACVWKCRKHGDSQHFRKCVTIPALDGKIRSQCWMAFLHFVVFMISNEKMKRIEEELRAAHGTAKGSIHKWQTLYHECLKSYMHSKNLNKIGGGSTRCVVDEIAVGKVGVRVGKPASRLGSMLRGPARIARREPCKTVWKTGARKGDAAKAKKSKDKRNNKNTQWIWLGVQCGKDKKAPATHGKGTKRVAAAVLPAASEAVDKKPRGHETLKAVLKKNLQHPKRTIPMYIYLHIYVCPQAHAEMHTQR